MLGLISMVSIIPTEIQTLGGGQTEQGAGQGGH